MAWGDAGIALAIFGSTLGVAGIVADRHARAGRPSGCRSASASPGDFRLAAFCVSEADAGSDVSNLKTRAVYDEATDTWTLNGTKTWITNGGIADIHVVVASVEPDLGARGQASFIVPPQDAGAVDGPEVQEDGDPGVPHRRGRAAGREGAGLMPARWQGQARRAPRPGPRGKARQVVGGDGDLRGHSPGRGGPGGRDRPRRLRVRARLRQGAHDLRQADHRAPGDRLQARRHEDAHRRRPAAVPAGGLDGDDRASPSPQGKARCRSSSPARRPSG